MRGQCIDFPPDLAPVAGPPTTADEQSISLICLWLQMITNKPYFRDFPTHFHKQHQFTNNIFNNNVSSLDLVLFWKIFWCRFCTRAKKNSLVRHKLTAQDAAYWCSEPSVIPLSCPGARTLFNYSLIFFRIMISCLSLALKIGWWVLILTFSVARLDIRRCPAWTSGLQHDAARRDRATTQMSSHSMACHHWLDPDRYLVLGCSLCRLLARNFQGERWRLKIRFWSSQHSMFVLARVNTNTYQCKTSIRYS